MSTSSEQRRAVEGLTALAERELSGLWAFVNQSSAEEVRDFLLETVPEVARSYHLAAAALAADWYDEIREVAQATGVFIAEPAEELSQELLESKVRYGVSPLFQPEPDRVAAQVLIASEIQRLVADGHRDTVRINSVRDRASAGWARIGQGDSCAFCRMLIGRGDVYTSSTVKFRTHTRCNCGAVPVWQDGSIGSREQLDEYVKSARRREDAEGKVSETYARDMARARQWIRDN